MAAPVSHIADFDLSHAPKLGSGKHRKFNAVYLVKHKETGTPGVYKQLLKTSQNEHLWPLLRQEASISFTQQGLPYTLAFAENETEIVLIRNFQEGMPLDAYWETIPRKEKAAFIKTLLAKLVPVFNVLKQQGIVHCDIKPSNIIVSGSLQDFNVHLIDFGMAVLKEHPAERKTLFALGYSAPELILNKLHLVDHTTDLFSLGITIWQLFTGKLPLVHANPGIMTNLQITHPLPDSRSIPTEIGAALQKMCFKHSFQRPPHHMNSEEVDQLLQSAMERRFQSLEEVLEAVDLKKKENWWGKVFGR